MINAAIEWITTVAPLQIIVWVLSGTVSLIGIITGGLKVRAVLTELEILKRAKAIQAGAVRSGNVADFTRDDISQSLANYIVPDCAQTDPSNSADIRRVAAVREQVFGVVDRFIERSDSRHLLILADTGMGKTTFCLNFLDYRDRTVRKSGTANTAVVPLGRPNAIEKIGKVPNPTETVLILDAFDEDLQAIEDSGQRIADLMAASASFQNVIITCRSQFFKNDSSIPSRTGVAVVRPRNSSAREYHFETLYLLPFTDPQIQRYVKSQFPLLSWNSRQRRAKAFRLAANVNELSARPMLLTLIPDLIKTGRSASELFDLYTFMIETWMERESSWIDADKLTAVSTRLASYIYTSRARRQTDRVTLDELNSIAEELSIPSQEWTHLRSRSLLNRDSEGNIKFSHRSIMEYFFVKAAIDGDEACFKVFWSDFMRDLFVSWGNTSEGRANISRAREILSLDLTALGLSPLSPQLDPARDYRSGAYLQKPAASRRRIPREWRGYSVKIDNDGQTRTVQDNEYGLIWELPRFDAIHDFNVLAMSQAELFNTGLSSSLASKEQLLSLIEIEETVGVDLLPRDTFIWLGDRIGKGRPVAVAISGVAIPAPSVKLLGSFGPKDRHGASIWAYEPAGSSGTFGAHAPTLTAIPTIVTEIDRESQRHMHNMTPAEVTAYIEALREGDLPAAATKKPRRTGPVAKKPPAPKSKIVWS